MPKSAQELKQAGELILNRAAFFEGLFEAAKIIEEVGDLGLAAQEAQNRVEKILKEEEEAKQALSIVQGDLQKAELNIEAAKKKVSDVESSARKGADELASAASENADKIIRDARKRNSELEASIKQKLSEETNIDARIQEKESELAALEKRITEIKEQAKNFAGA